jgi:hypothetical protein
MVERIGQRRERGRRLVRLLPALARTRVLHSDVTDETSGHAIHSALLRSESSDTQDDPLALILTCRKTREERLPYRKGDRWLLPESTQTLQRLSPESSSFMPTFVMEKISRAVEKKPGMTAREVRVAGGNSAHADTAVGVLKSGGYIEMRRVGAAHHHYSLKPFRHSEEAPESVPKHLGHGPSGHDQRNDSDAESVPKSQKAGSDAVELNNQDRDHRDQRGPSLRKGTGHSRRGTAGFLGRS